MRPNNVVHAALDSSAGGIVLTGDVTGFVAGGLGPLRKGDAVYCSDAVMAALPRLVANMAKGAVIGTPKRMMGATVNGVRFLSYAVWGVNDAAGLDHTWDDCFRARIVWHSTAAATVAAMLPSKSALAPRWRGVAQAALYAGPVLHARGGCEHGIHIDRIGAYAQSCELDMPGDGAWYMDNPTPWRAMSDPLGFVHALVRVKETGAVSDIPPLPVRVASGGMVFPVGVFDGVWPAFLLKRAVDAKECEILKVRYRIRPASKTRAYADIADKLRGINKRTGKPLYTRIWGKMITRGGTMGTPERREGCYWEEGLWWGPSTSPIWDPRMPAVHRPDVAAHIVGRNLCEMIDASRTMKPGSLIGMHVDSIWSADVDAGAALVGDRWSEKGRGRIRFTGPGRYGVHDAKGTYWGHSGGDPVTTERELEDGTGNTTWRRGWTGDPRRDITASSVPPDVDLANAVTKIEGYSPSDPVWDGRAYLPDATVRVLKEELKAWDI